MDACRRAADYLPVGQTRKPEETSAFGVPASAGPGFFDIHNAYLEGACSEVYPVLFAFHSYPWLIHRLTYCRTNHKNPHVRGYKEEGAITTDCDMIVPNDLDRFRLVRDAIDRVGSPGSRGVTLKGRV